MSLVNAVKLNTIVRAWHASGDSRVAFISELPGADGPSNLYYIQLINRPGHKYEVLTAAATEAAWLIRPRIDVEWVNVGSVWVRNEDHRNWKRPVPRHLWCSIKDPLTVSGHVRFHAPTKGKSQQFLRGYFDFMCDYTRLWGSEVPKGEIPSKPLPYQAKTLPGRPKKVAPLSAIDRLLEKDLIQE